jgi:putative endonuclease
LVHQQSTGDVLRQSECLRLRSVMPTPRSKLGATGEVVARHYLESKGHIWIESNWHCSSGEIDLVMREGTELVFVEVKTRRGEAAGRAEEGVSANKSRRLLATGSWYLSSHPELGDPIWRIDLVAITLDRSGRVERVTHIPNAVVSG